MSAQEQIQAAQLEAAHALSNILTQQGILHAFIGGFGIQLLGATRPTEDIDAMIDVGDPREIIDRIQDLPLLQPSILILTKIKRWAMLSESTRPRSIVKAQMDLEDIKYLLRWLAQHKEKIDFAGYEAADPKRLFDAVRQLVQSGKRDGNTSLLELLFSVLTEEDLAKIKDA
ncbi:MAG: hypothetical protein M1816_004959 [Peltula sp. TS41687]|nr:MAG: hypothetical protein M1816_004959 [Peltula sp. TS41687]